LELFEGFFDGKVGAGVTGWVVSIYQDREYVAESGKQLVM
jgi:hypothetical protein